jgi:RNA recognition motif-containing protein
MDQQQPHNEENDHVYGHEEKGEEDVAGKIFIGGLSWQTTEQTLRAHFERYGELTDVALMFDKRSNKPRYSINSTPYILLAYSV